MTSAIAISCSHASRRLDGGNVDLLHRHHRLERTSCLSATGRKRIGQRTWGDLPREAPAVLAPTARAFLAAVADDRIPVAVRLCLIVRCDLEGKGLAVLECRAAVETEAGNAEDGELHRQNIAGLAARVVGRRLVDSGHFTIRKGGGVEPRRVLCVLVEPEADRVFRFHVSFTLFPKLAALWNEAKGDVPALTFCPSHHPPTRSARNIVSSQVLDRSSWRTRYVSPSAPFSLKYR